METHFGYKVSMILLPLGCIFQVISVASPYWISATKLKAVNLHLGLWKQCLELTLKSVTGYSCTAIDNEPDWFKATKGLAVIGLVLGALCVLLMFIRCCCSKSKAVGVLTLVTAVVAAIFTLLGVAIFAAKVTDLLVYSGTTRLEIARDYLSWAWYFGLASCIVSLVSVFFLACGVVSSRSGYSGI